MDDGADPVEDLVPADPRIRYLRLPRKVSVGAVNAISPAAPATGEAWSLTGTTTTGTHPGVCLYQITSLLTQQADLCGLDTLWFFDPRYGTTAGSFCYKSAGGVSLACRAAAFAYRRALWERHRFSPTFSTARTPGSSPASGELEFFQLERADFYVARIHAGNTNPKRPGSTYWQSAPAENHSRVPCSARTLPPSWPAARNRCRPSPDAKPPIARAQRREEVQVEKLNLGCADALIEGFVNVGYRSASRGHNKVDLRKAWPWADSSIDYVRAWDIIEHLPDKVFTMNEIWRVLAARVHRGDPPCPRRMVSKYAFQDPTHRFLLEPDGVSCITKRAIRTGERFAASYGVQAGSFRVVFERTRSDAGRTTPADPHDGGQAMTFSSHHSFGSGDEPGAMCARALESENRAYPQTTL